MSSRDSINRKIVIIPLDGKQAKTSKGASLLESRGDKCKAGRPVTI